MRTPENFGHVFDPLKCYKRLVQIRADGEATMLSEKDRVVIADQWTDNLRVFVRRRRGICADRYIAECEYNFGQQVGGKFQPGHG